MLKKTTKQRYTDIQKTGVFVNAFAKYQNPEIKQELRERGFCVYEHWDFKEFLDSIEMKYLGGILKVRKIGWLLGIGMMVTFFVNPLLSVYSLMLIVGVHMCLFVWLSVYILEHVPYF